MFATDIEFKFPATLYMLSDEDDMSEKEKGVDGDDDTADADEADDTEDPDGLEETEEEAGGVKVNDDGLEE